MGIASTVEKSETHAQHMIEFLRKWGFDGYDIDWEYPVVAGHNNVNMEATPQDYDNYIRMLRILREAFEAEAAETGQTQLLLTAAVGVGRQTADVAYNVAEMNKYLDLVGLMTYDMHGTWEDITNFNAPLYTTAEDEETYDNAASVDFAVNYWLDRGIDAHKLVVGFGTYGRGWKLANSNNHGVFAPTNGGSAAGPTDSGPGYMGYFDIKHMLDEGLATRYWDDERKVPYIVTNTNDLDVLGEFPLLNVIRDSLADYNPLGDNPVDLDGSAANDSTEESGANTAIIAVLASGVGLAALAGGLYMFFQGVPSMPSLGGLSKAIPEPSAPKLTDQGSMRKTHDSNLDCEDIDALKKQIARLEAMKAEGASTEP